MKKLPRLLPLVFACTLMAFSCTSDDLSLSEPDPVDSGDTPADGEGSEEDDFTPIGNVEVLLPAKMDDNYILVNDANANRVYLMDKQARLLHEWSFTNGIGNDVFLLPDGRLLGSMQADEPVMAFGGQGGKLQFIGPDDQVEWEFVYSSPDAELHHDAEMLPNGNVIALVWERRSAEDGVAAGSMVDIDLFPDAIIEVNPQTDEIVWEWHAWDHLIQDFDDSKLNFGTPSENPGLIDLNHAAKTDAWPSENGDLMHANGISYDAVNDVILVSANFYSEVWAIDHSTTTAEAAGHTGGNFGRGGDLIYRFGNPGTYGNEQGTRLFFNNHFPNVLTGADQGKLLIFSNGNGMDQSTVYELQLPETYDLVPDADNEPEVLWSFTHPDLYSGKVSGAVPLPNGNILITEGDFGFWEVTREKEVVWKFQADGFFWRGYHYDKGSPEVGNLGF